ncbi:HFL097Wp [Eremothecium sinecaudum]|uniref:HFL097Wp n=1 Tax=Eremothecium sinecaudum TaxID=45286 RepID=A0A0X8HUP5_9SACH|nr:HFL097Wp [Eremothecium sinecaudum]AMD21759.1 HFL097Wp [Eremothecium sinecaudum]
MVYVYHTQLEGSEDRYWIVTGKDKFENDLLIKYGYRDLNYIWFHADKYSSGHIYLKLLPNQKSIDDVPREIVADCLQLCKSESIHGNKLPQCTIICTPWHNLKKSGYMKPGEVSFKTIKSVRKLECYARDNKVVNRLKKTRIEIAEDVEKLLHDAKQTKNSDFLVNYVQSNRERLINEEIQRLQQRKNKKKRAYDNDYGGDPVLDS